MLLLERLLGCVERCVDGFPDERRGRNPTYRMRDFEMAAFSVLYTQNPSFLAYQKRLEQGHGRSNCTFNIVEIPSDNHIRDMLDPVQPAQLHPAFDAALTALEQAPGGLNTFRRLDNRVLVALDSTENLCSNRIRRPIRAAGRISEEV